MNYRPHVISWNLTQRCNLLCTHCYISAVPQVGNSEKLTTQECRRVMDEIAQINPSALLILSGGEPLLRPDLFDLAASIPLIKKCTMPFAVSTEPGRRR